MAEQDEYKLTRRRTTDELESDDTTVNSKCVSIYGWDYSASAKVRIAVTSAGALKVTT